jgi:hypothetical protein
MYSSTQMFFGINPAFRYPPLEKRRRTSCSRLVKASLADFFRRIRFGILAQKIVEFHSTLMHEHFPWWRRSCRLQGRTMKIGGGDGVLEPWSISWRSQNTVEDEVKTCKFRVPKPRQKTESCKGLLDALRISI